VIDFLQFFYNWDEQKYWPIFNVADSALVCGVILLLIFLHYHGAEGELGAPVGKPGEPEGKPGDQYKPIVKSDD
jgi:signal peptidase II